MIDAHVHVLPTAMILDRAAIGAADPWFEACHPPERLIADESMLLDYMDRNQIERAVVFTWPFAEHARCVTANTFVGELQGRLPSRIIGFGIVNLRDPLSLQEIQRCAELGLRGVGELNADAQGWSEHDPLVSECMHASAERHLIWNVHASEPVGHQYAGKGVMGPERLLTMHQQCPDLRLVLSHLGGGLPLLAHMPEVKVACQELWFDTAAMPFLYEPSALRAAIDVCGAERMMFGSDFPLLASPRYQSMSEAAGLTAPEQDQLFSLVAQGLFGD